MAAKVVNNGLLCIILSIGILLNSCTDANRIVDDSKSIANRNWSYNNKIRYDVKIDNPNMAYALYLNLRVSGDYRYSNIFILLHTDGPGQKPATTRFEVKLADAEGKWLGEGSGELYNYQTLLNGNYHFPAKGIYHIEIEQNMRDNPLRGVSDVGLRVAKASK